MLACCWNLFMSTWWTHEFIIISWAQNNKLTSELVEVWISVCNDLPWSTIILESDTEHTDKWWRSGSCCSSLSHFNGHYDAKLLWIHNCKLQAFLAHLWSVFDAAWTQPEGPGCVHTCCLYCVLQLCPKTGAAREWKHIQVRWRGSSKFFMKCERVCLFLHCDRTKRWTKKSDWLQLLRAYKCGYTLSSY